MLLGGNHASSFFILEYITLFITGIIIKSWHQNIQAAWNFNWEGKKPIWLWDMTWIIHVGIFSSGHSYSISRKVWAGIWYSLSTQIKAHPKIFLGIQYLVTEIVQDFQKARTITYFTLYGQWATLSLNYTDQWKLIYQQVAFTTQDSWILIKPLHLLGNRLISLNSSHHGLKFIH